ncbi:ornithine decarboxylase [Veillonella criceti]|uniref:ornithine decarboxylase n=1 Tax=Veillonella criceti TaxID=103891 RepID=A0A380NPD2_9FIRM|nr:ornithine decarboxylase [Veillonella criceti]SUP44455.1 Ornithine decarboxylase, constitutive [Veillonella criceti]
MSILKVAISEQAEAVIGMITKRPVIRPTATDFTDVGAVLIGDCEIDTLATTPVKAFDIPVFVVRTGTGMEGLTPEQVAKAEDTVLRDAYGILDSEPSEREFYARRVETAVQNYEQRSLPPFFSTLRRYVETGNSQFNCPGHQGGQFFRKHPAGRAFYDFYGENIFRSDLCNADVQLGDLLIHEGYALDAQEHAAQVFNADKTYFVLNGTSTSNKVVLNALLAPGDIVLYDRNNHKSISHGALVQAGAIPVYLETARNPFGSIGGIPEACFDETVLWERIAERDPAKAKAERPIRLAVIQLGTYDGTIYNARQVVDKIGHLCDYILFDSAWVGYEQFIPMMKDCSPLLLELGPDDPGIIVTQSVHKQLAGFSQTSQIHKKDGHIRGQARYVNQKRFNNAFMMHASTSPFYPLFAALDVNAKIHAGEGGLALWHDCVAVGIEARKTVLRNCQYLRPLVPPMVHGKPWEEGKTVDMAQDIAYFSFEPDAKWHSFAGYGDGQYFIDPCKFQLITPGINMETGAYESFGIPATILANYLREHQVIPEKCDLNTILFLLTPAESYTKMDALIAKLLRFEQLIEADAPMQEVLPTLYAMHIDKYRGYTIRQLCQEMHDFYKARQVSQLQQRLFQKDYFPTYVKTPQEANIDFVRGYGELVPIADCVGRIALEGALPYPPGVICVQPGEVWSETARDYFVALEEGINALPGFAPELQGVYIERDETGYRRAYAYVLREAVVVKA